MERVRRARSDAEVVRAYHNLLTTSLHFRTITIMGCDAQAQTMFRRLRTQGMRLGTQDVRIATIAFRHGATLVTRNVRDFATIPALNIEDWSLPVEDVTSDA